MMKQYGILVVPTMSVYERIRKLRTEENISHMYEVLYPSVRKFHEAGLTMAVGTDTMGGIFPFGGSAYELELYVEKVGLSPIDAIKIGTLNGIKVMGLEDKLGTIEANKIADIIAVDGAPLDDISVLQDTDRIKLVLTGGSSVKNRL